MSEHAFDDLFGPKTRTWPIWQVFGFAVMVAMIAAAVGLYGFKNEARERETHIAELRKSIAAERELLSLVEAEWSALNDPGRIQMLAQHFLELRPLGPSQRVSIAQLPLRPEPPRAQSIEELLETFSAVPIAFEANATEPPIQTAPTATGTIEQTQTGFSIEDLIGQESR